MSDNSVFDAKCLSDDELYSTQIELVKRKTQAARLNRMDAVSQLDMLLQNVEQERRERMFLDRWNRQPSSSVVIETDPDLQEKATHIEDEKDQKNPPVRPIRRALRTDKPVLPNEGC